MVRSVTSSVRLRLLLAIEAISAIGAPLPRPPPAPRSRPNILSLLTGTVGEKSFMIQNIFTDIC